MKRPRPNSRALQLLSFLSSSSCSIPFALHSARKLCMLRSRFSSSSSTIITCLYKHCRVCSASLLNGRSDSDNNIHVLSRRKSLRVLLDLLFATQLLSFSFLQHSQSASASTVAAGDAQLSNSTVSTESEGDPLTASIDPSVEEPVITDRVYLDIRATGEQSPIRVTIGLYGKVVPTTVSNFLSLIAKGYAGTRVYRIVPSLTVQMGDVLNNGGKSGRAAITQASDTFPPENYKVSHSVSGIVSMARDRNGNVDSRFFVATRIGDSKYLDGRYVAFGRVLDGIDELRALERLVGRASIPKKPIVIERCGVL